MKIGFVSNCYAPRIIGGAELVMQWLAEACRDAGHEVFVVTLGPDGEDSIDEVGGVRVHRLATRNVYWPFEPGARRSLTQKAVFHVRDLINRDAAAVVADVMARERPDIVSTHNLPGFSVAVWEALARAGLPVVHTLHDYHLTCVKSTRYRDAVCDTPCQSCRVASMPRRRASRQVAAVVGVSRHVLDHHLRAGFFQGIASAVVHNGYPLLGARPVADVPRGVLRLGFLGRVERTKGIEVLLQSLAHVPDMPVTLDVGGRGDEGYIAMLRARYPDPRVRWLGFTQRAEFYQRIDALIVPSLWEEPFGGVIVEAWEWGLPTVVSAHGGMRELVTDGVTGLSLPPGDAAALAATFGRLAAGELSAPWQVNARLDARRRLVPRTMAQSMLTLFEQVLSQQGRLALSHA